MGLVEEHVEADPAALRALEDAFAQFSQQTAELKEAYLKLKQRTDRINCELEEANRRLERKVQELDEANNFQASILGSIPTAVVVTDLDGVVRALNPAAEAMWGVSAREALGRDFRQIMGPHGELLVDALAGRRRQESLRRELSGPEPRIISSSAALVGDSDGRPIGAVQIDRDITRLCSLESRLYQQEKLADLGEMAAALAHEIRKPLNGIKGFASLLQRRMEAEEPCDRYIGSIMAAADRLNGMLGRLLDFARPDDTELGPCALRAEAEEVAEFVRAEGLDESARIEVAVPDGAQVVVADPDKLKQVLLNLVKNGVEALGGPGVVRIVAEPCSEDGRRCVRVAVTDTGCGIAPEKIRKLGQPFFSEKEGGTGLGLAIVNRILQLHGTGLQVDSHVGRGTSMAFVLAAGRRSEER